MTKQQSLPLDLVNRLMAECDTLENFIAVSGSAYEDKCDVVIRSPDNEKARYFHVRWQYLRDATLLSAYNSGEEVSSISISHKNGHPDHLSLLSHSISVFADYELVRANKLLVGGVKREEKRRQTA